jgi:sugar lactone lactonase YvrE
MGAGGSAAQLAIPDIEVFMELRSFVRPLTALACATAITACGNRDDVTATPSGALAVIVNTPIARSGAVAIHGPSASSARVASTDTLRGLTPGQYLARAEDGTAADSLVSPVLTGAISDTAVMVEADAIDSVTATYAIRGGSGALWVGKWDGPNLAEGFTSPQLAAAGTAVASDTIGSAATSLTIAGTAIDSAGNLWVTDYINQQILKFTPAQLASGQSTPTVAILTDKEPWGIAFDAHGNLWVSYYNGNNVLKYAASDVSSWSGALGEPAPSLSVSTPNGPLSIAFDANENLWVAGFDEAITYEVAAASLDGSGTVVPTDSLESPYLDHGSGLAFDRAGNLWEGTESGYVVSYSSAQLAAASHGDPAFAQQSPVYRFDGLAFDNSGNLWAGTETENVAMYSPSQQSGGDLSAPARTLVSSAGARTFGLAFNTHDAALPIASTLSARAGARAPRTPRAMAVHRAPPPVVHSHDGSRPGSLRRR